MALSKITLTWTGDATDGDWFGWSRRHIGGGGETVELETFWPNDPRWTAGEAVVQTPTATPGEASMLEWLRVWNIDYNAYGLYTFLVLAPNQIEIEFSAGLPDSWEFYDVVDLAGIVTEVIANGTAPEATFNLTSEVHQASTVENICDYVEVEITTNIQATQYRDNGGAWIPVVANPILFQAIRGVKHNIEIQDGTPITITLDEFYYDYLSGNKATVNITPTIVGATIQIVDSTIEGLTVQYSLDNITYQSSNIFTGQAAGAGTAYLKDQFGCVKSKDYTVTAFTVTPDSPYLFISKANSINYSLCETWDGYNTFKNDQNTLAVQSLNTKNYCELLLFQTLDKTKTQFKSNFDTISVVVREEDGTETPQTITQYTENISRFESMDCVLYAYKTGKTGVYFETGDTYDTFDSPIVGGEFALNGNLPDFAIIDTIVTIDGIGSFPIEDVVFDATINKRVIVFDNVYSGTPFAAGKVKTIYDLLPFEVFEFEIDWSLFGEGVYDVLINNDDTTMDSLVLQSENVWVQDVHDALAIRYYNRNNRDIFYKFGIEHFIRMPYIMIEGKPKDEFEINITDLTSTVIDSSVHEVNIFKFDAVTKEVMRKLVIALSCETVFINGIGYIKDGGITVKHIEHTNLYEVEAEMLKTNINYTTKYGNNYNNNEDGAVGVEVSNKPQKLPALLSQGNGYVKI